MDCKLDDLMITGFRKQLMSKISKSLWATRLDADFTFTFNKDLRFNGVGEFVLTKCPKSVGLAIIAFPQRQNQNKNKHSGRQKMKYMLNTHTTLHQFFFL